MAKTIAAVALPDTRQRLQRGDKLFDACGIEQVFELAFCFADLFGGVDGFVVVGQEAVDVVLGSSFVRLEKFIKRMK